MWENPKSALNRYITIIWKKIQKVRDTNTTIPLGKRNKSAPDKDVTMEEQKILKVRNILDNQRKRIIGAHDTNVTIEWNRILKVHEILT